MNRRFLSLIVCLISFLLFTSLFPSICFSESKTVVGEDCQIYLGDMKNKKELDEIRKSVKVKSIEDGLKKLDEKDKDWYILDECIPHIISQYLEKVVVVSHTEKGRKICEKVKITLDAEVMNEFLSQTRCKRKPVDLFQSLWEWNIDSVLAKKSDKMINVGLIIETKTPYLDEHKKELLENEQESQFHGMIELRKDKYQVVDRRHLTKILDEQKLSSSGITDSETVKLGKILNLDIIVLRVLYDKSQVTKVLKVDTGEVLLFKTYETKTEEGWVFFSKSEDGDFFYDKQSMTKISPNVARVWEKRSNMPKSYKDKYVQMKNKTIPHVGGLDKPDSQVTLYEVDCKNYTIKTLKTVIYNDKGKVLEDFDFPNSSIEQIIPESIGDSLFRKVCQE